MSLTNEKAILEIVEKEANIFLDKENVIGVALGTKYANGVDSKNLAIQILVEKKVDKDSLSAENLVPKDYKGFETDVIEIGKIEALGNTTKTRPMIFGYSIGPASMYLAGTSGCLVYDRTSYYILSNNHVMAGENTNPIGTPIMQPARLDGGIYPNDLVANLYRFVPIKFMTTRTTPINYVDAAIAKVVNVNGVVTKNIASIGPVKGIVLPSINLPVRKSGRTTGYTMGRIIAIGATVNVAYSGGKVAQFRNQIITTAMSAAGDSGSLLVDNNSRAVGLLFAGSTSITIYNPINDVLASLGVNIALG